MTVVDTQVHVAPRDDPNPANSGDRLLQLMEESGVGMALLTARTRYDLNNDFLLELAGENPDSFHVVGFVDPSVPDVEERVAYLASLEVFVALRLVVLSDRQLVQWNDGEFETVFAASARHVLPLCIWAPGRLRELEPVISRHGDLQWVLDHAGMAQDTNACRRDPEPFERLPELLHLSAYENVAVKLTGIETLSLEDQPHRDLWPVIEQLVSSFGIERLMWGSNLRGNTMYDDTLRYILDCDQLSASDKESILGKSACRLFRLQAATPKCEFSDAETQIAGSERRSC